MQYLKIYTKHDVLALTRLRRFETKLGECVQLLHGGKWDETALEKSTAKFVMLGVPEDIGVKANAGTGGADTLWQPFLQAFLNIQSNDFLQGEEVLLLGHLDFSELSAAVENNALSAEERIDAYRHAVPVIDTAVEDVVKQITRFGKIPLVIGGGHNNAYGCIKGAAKGLHKAGVLPIAQINAINLDAHADYRPTEGRHSGNAFRYAEEDGYLEKYCVIGLHENYLTQNTWIDIVNNPFIDITTYEDIFLHEKRSFREAITDAISFTDATWVGIELDVDCIEHTLSSAATPSGITALHARRYLHYTASACKAAYLHICEGATQLNDGRRDETTGKLVSYLVADFVKAALADEQP
ncbi:formimidoylglutamase [Deminuibacter soli]|uniref:Arginase n=1 Tax=Deminuibacter soli TaxID=2291815 RepID=A0A3E1NK55_9BACT|nr:formimidoylglutamase [Deminuibacter soli]RFM28325.1 arginase [Deminuibacter soli]